MTKYNSIMVLGAGQMGAGIAQVAAQAGIKVKLNDLKEEFVNKGLATIKSNLQRSVSKGRMDSSEAEEVLSRVRPSMALDDAADVDLVIEAIVENLDIKANVFQQLDQICPPKVVFASNTSSLPITQLAGFTNRPDKFIGMHFMNPVPVMKLVEVIRGLATSDAVAESIVELSKVMGKVPVTVNDYPGFVANRVLMPMINEAIYAVFEGVGTPEAVDEIMRLGANHPMGPLALADLIGLDTCLAIMNVLHDGFGDSKYRPCPLLKQYVQAGWMGKKTKKGFYNYE
ncbi:3-hydroxybutyryl-CoA dehydrogenase [Metallumcola ferriviriculae]|uniref:3-hydroxybutyryl-CoA dehydrogenase n=1 Tax=Metallumcola ferriviriculae TaxID=3039180 RepID=A0AAU0UNT6_9FIRM|nr:3-hydroxybutyryl-CoA dehydrogenase [Desulfitibacteraceae bacterium MK1]